MKQTYRIYQNGKHVANQLAGTAERATGLAAAKMGVDHKTLRAVCPVNMNPQQERSATIEAAFESFFADPVGWVAE